MSRWNEREIARKLAERESFEPPAGLLEKIKGEIPPTLPVGVPQPEARRPSPSPQRWLIAASLVAMVGAGLFALRVQKEAGERGMAAPTSAAAEKDSRAVAPPPQGPAAAPPLALQRRQEEPRLAGRVPAVPPPSPPAPKPSSKQEARELKALGYVAVPSQEQQPAGAPGGVAGGLTGASPPAAPPPPAPAQAAAAPQKAAEPQQQDFDAFEEMPVQAEKRAAPSTDERKTDRARQDKKQDKEKIPTAVAITAEGAPTPYVRGPRFRLLRFHLDGVAAGAQETVVFDPAVVVQYRQIDGDGADMLYEIELRSELPQEGMVAALFLNDPPGTWRELALSALAPSWEQASPDFRLSALAARFLETLKNRPGAKEELARIVRQMREIGKQPGGARAAGLADRMEKTAGLRPPP